MYVCVCVPCRVNVPHTCGNDPACTHTSFPSVPQTPVDQRDPELKHTKLKIMIMGNETGYRCLWVTRERPAVFQGWLKTIPGLPFGGATGVNEMLR